MPAPIPAALTELDALGKFVVAQLVASSSFRAALGALAGAGAMSAAETSRRIFSDVAPEGGPFPLFVYTIQFAPHVVGPGGHSIMQKATVAAKLVGKNVGYGQLSAAVAAMGQALAGDQAFGTVDGWDVSGYRSESLRYTETAGKDLYRHVGIILEVFVSAI
jgi:hypothetical protein